MVDKVDRSKYAKGWLCTWPHCPLSKEDALDLLRARYDLDEWVIAEEEHADGEPHLHAFLKLTKRKNFKASMFDLGDYHGNYQIAKSWRAVQEYCKKDGNYISNIDLKAARQKQSKMKKEDLLKDPEVLMDEGRLNPMQLCSFLKNSAAYKMLLQQKRKPPVEMPEKKRHFWIWGPSNTGKTTWLREKMQEGEWFQMPTNNDWNGYSGEDNLYIDEYKGQLTIQELNRICDGGAKVNTKGGTAMLSWTPIVYVLSNFSPSQCYGKCNDALLETLLNRFQVGKMEEFAKPTFGYEEKNN